MLFMRCAGGLKGNEMHRWSFVCAAVALISGLCGCASTTDETREVGAGPASTITVCLATTAGDIVVELDRERAPISVENFLKYADRGAYDGTIFHRVIPQFVIQGGGYVGGGNAELIERAKVEAAGGVVDAPIKNEWQNGLKNVRGTIAMARDAEPDTATREFYINLQDNAKLDTAREMTGHAGYAVFGKVVSGMEVVDAIRVGETKAVPEKDMKDVPVKPVVVKTVRRVGGGVGWAR